MVRWETYVEFCGSKEEVDLRIKDGAKDFFDLEKTLRPPSNSEKFVKLLLLLKKHTWASNEEISSYIGFKQSMLRNPKLIFDFLMRIPVFDLFTTPR
ncbi:MAG: hypothetical protein HYV97_03175 [Bdellovibrio sp.]|nr:hypothetical protein [Bdellovibrio sp.]